MKSLSKEKILIEKILVLLCSEGLLDTKNDQALRKCSKEDIRKMHSFHREQVIAKERSIISKKDKLLEFFATGNEICPSRIDPKLIVVKSNTKEALLFRLATLLWSVPVSKGFGRRMRFLVIDEFTKKLIGIFALGDPVFNLSARDSWVGWSSDDRKARLINVMDAYVLGAVPPYNMLLGGKLIASLIGSLEVSEYYMQKYEGSRGVISGQVKSNKLALITVTSALGRSSLYNRLLLPGLVELIKLGQTKGYGHFHISNQLFEFMRELLLSKGHSYALGYKYGCGPNWRMRVIRQALSYVGVNIDVLKHGISREVYAMPIATNWREFLQGTDDNCMTFRPSIKEISEACLQRWVVPRSQRMPGYKQWTNQDTKDLFESILQ